MADGTGINKLLCWECTRTQHNLVATHAVKTLIRFVNCLHILGATTSDYPIHIKI